MKLRLNLNQDITKFLAYCDKLLKAGAFIEIKIILPIRSNQQNRYMHLIFAWFAIEYGETTEYVKQVIFKRDVNQEIFKREYVNRKTGEVREDWRSTADLDSKELTIAIERFRNWSSKGGIYLPAPNEQEYLKHIQIEIDRNKEYI